MSILAPPLTHQPFSESDLYSTSPLSSASTSTSGTALLTPQSADGPLVPFPIFQHRHTSPYPVVQTFSALGPESSPSPPKPSVVLGSGPTPPAPKAPLMDLPTGPDIILPPTMPPTPDPSPPNSKVLFPDAMIRLAPPADESFNIDANDLGGPIDHASEETPRRFPLVSVDQVILEPETQPILRKKASVQAGTALNGRAKSSGPQGRAMRRSQTAVHPSSVRLADAQIPRMRSSATAARSASSQLLNTPRSTSPGLPRTLTAPVPDSLSMTGSSQEMGGPEGLEAKVVLLGSQNAGKTSLILRYTTNTFSPTPAAATIGSSLHARKLIHDGVRVKLQIWDTAGQERFRSMAPIYYRGAHVCVLVYDVTDRSSFDDVRSWLEELSRTVSKETAIYVVGSKVDLVKQRVVTPQEAHSAIRTWVRPPTPPRPQVASPVPSSRNIFRPSSQTPRADATPATTSHHSSVMPTRAPSHSALASLEGLPSIPPPRQSSEQDAAQVKFKPFPASPSAKSVLRVTTSKLDADQPSSSRSRKMSIPTLQSPTLPTSVTFTEPIRPSLTSSSPPTRHGISGGRFSLSNVLGYSKAPNQGGAVSNLSRLAQEHPASPKVNQSAFQFPTGRALSFGADSSTSRPRTESNPMLDNRRKSEDWSSRPWRMGEGPGAAEALGEFGAGIKKRQSGELLGANLKVATVPVPGGPARTGRARGGSLGRDPRLYDGVSEGEEEWGVEVEGMRVGEVSAATGQGVEALFKSISALLVQKRERLERERTLRHKDSVMLTDDHSPLAKDSKNKTRGCCA